jgi:transposase
MNGRTVAMATNDWTDDDDFDDEVTNQQYEDGSDLLKKLRKAKRADEKRIKELTDQLETLSKAQRERVVKEVLDAKGVNPKAARLIMKDLDDVNEESVSHWLDDNADLFGLEVKQQEDPKKQLDLAALRQQDIVTQGAQTPNPGMDADQMLNDATSADDIIRMIQSGNF